ncbi:MAG: ABC transporter substrate-binding protein [Dehalococcoidia bacterium]
MKKLMAAVVLAMTIFSLACGNDERQNVSLALDWYPNSNHAGIYEALGRGFFEEEGLDVNVYTPTDPASILQTVGAGRDDFGISYQPVLLQARSEGVPVVSIAAVSQHPLNSVMTLTSSGLERPGDLAGRRIGHPGIPSNEGMLETMLNEDGVSIDQVELVNVGFDLAQALLGGTVDAIVGAYWTHESILMELEGHEINILRMEEWGVPDFYELVLVTNETILAEDRDVVEQFVRAFRRGYEAAAEDPQASITSLIEANPETVNEPLEREGVELLVPMWTDAPRFGWQEESRWTDFADWMKARDLINDDVDPADAFTNEFVED